MRNYHPKKSILTMYERKMAIAIIQGYDDMVAQLDGLINQGVVMDGQPHSSTPGDPVGMAVIRRSEKSRAVDTINEALKAIPIEYRDVVFRWVKTGQTLEECGGEYAHRNTYSRWKEVFLYEVATRMGWHEDWHQF